MFLHHHHDWASLLVSRRNEKSVNCYAKSSLGQLTLADAQAQEMNLLYYIILLILLYYHWLLYYMSTEPLFLILHRDFRAFGSKTLEAPLGILSQ